MAWLWTVAIVAKEFGVLPSVAAQDIGDDPEQSAVVCAEMLLYAQAHAAHKRANKAEIKAWSDSHMMRQVVDTAHDLAEEELSAAVSEIDGTRGEVVGAERR